MTDETRQTGDADAHAGPWFVSLDQAHGVGDYGARRRHLAFAGVFFALGVVALGMGVVGGGTRWSFSLAFFFLAVLCLLPVMGSRIAVARDGRAWRELSTPEGVDAKIVTKHLGADAALMERRRGVLRACMPVAAGQRWDRLADECRAFGIAAPSAVVIAQMDQFRELRRAAIPDAFVEPVELGHAADAGVVRSILRDTRALAALGAIILYALYLLWNQQHGGARSLTGYAIVGVTLALLWKMFRSPTGGLPGAARSALAAPGIVVVQTRAGDAAFTRDDSVLVVRRDPRRIHGALATLTRRDGVRTTLDFPTQEDPRLLALWSMWRHPRSSDWDERTGTITPANGP